MPASSKKEQKESKPYAPKSSEEAEEAYRLGAKLLRELAKDKEFGKGKAGGQKK